MSTAANSKTLFLVIVTYLAFISLGLPDGLLGIAWPFMSTRLNVPLESLGVLLIGFTLGYLVTSSTSGKIMKHMTLGMLLALSCLSTGLCLLTYAFSDAWYMVVAASFLLGSGGGAIDSSINTFAASRFSAGTINWLHAFYGVGATAGPLLVTFMLARNFQWHHGYITVSFIQISLAVLFLFTQKNWITHTPGEEQVKGPGYLETLKIPVVWINIVIFFLYTGIEQGFGQWIFTILTKSRGMGAEEAGLWTSAYWGSLTAGRILFGIILTRIPVQKVLNGAMPGIVAGIILVTLNIHPYISLSGIVILGLSNAPVFPSLIAVTPDRVGRQHAATAIGMQISLAMLGASLVPGFAGLLSDWSGIEVIPKILTAAAVLLSVLFLSTSSGKSQEQ